MGSAFRDYLGNLKDKNLGKLCQINEVTSFDKPIIIGKITKILPLVKKGNYQPNDVLLIHLKEVFSSDNSDKKSRWEFKAVFVARSAQLISNVNLNIGDFILFCNVKLTTDACLRRPRCFYPKQIVIGLWPQNPIKDVYYRRSDMDKWVSFPNVTNESSEIPNSNLDEERSDNIHSEEDDNDCSILNNGLIPSIERDSRESSITRTDNREKQNVHSSPKPSTSSTSVVSNREKLDVPSSKPSTSSARVLSNLNIITKNTFNDPENVIISNLYRYVKLNEIGKNSKVNIYGIILKILKKPALTPTNKYHLMINVIDETKTDEFFVHVFARSIDEFPVLKPYCIVRLHRLQIEEHEGRLDGRVFSGRDVLVFDKDDTNIIYKTSKKCTLTEADKQRVNELKEWMLENIPTARPFTSLCNLEMKLQKINLRGEITAVKVYEDSPVVALRIRDGTKCTIPFYRLSLNPNAWKDVLIESKSCCSESEEVDIIIAEPDKNFRQLKIGDHVELLTVETIVKTEFVKTKVNNHLTLCMKGVWENLKSVQSKTNEPIKSVGKKPSSYKENPVGEMLSRSFEGEGSSKKRKLFDPETSINFESEDIGNENVNDGNRNARIIDSQANNDNEEDCPRSKKMCEVVSSCSTAAVEVAETEPSTEVIEPNNEVVEPNNEVAEPNNEVVNSNNGITELHNNEVTVVMTDVEHGRSEISKENSTDFLTAWPEIPPKEFFNIKVYLISTDPSIDERSSDSEIMTLVKSYCRECKVFRKYCGEIDFIHPKDAGFSALICVKCKENGLITKLQFLLRCEMLLEDQNNEMINAVLLGTYADKFFGCVTEDVFTSTEVRCNIKKQINSLLKRRWNKKIPLVVRIMPMNWKNGIPDFHIINIQYA